MKAISAQLIVFLTLPLGLLSGFGKLPAQAPQSTAIGPAATTIRLSMIVVDAADHSVDDVAQKEVEF
jgi:hypothetical protein